MAEGKAPDNRTGMDKGMNESPNDGYKDYGNYGGNDGDKRDTEDWKPANKALYDRVGSLGKPSDGAKG